MRAAQVDYLDEDEAWAVVDRLIFHARGTSLCSRSSGNRQLRMHVVTVTEIYVGALRNHRERDVEHRSERLGVLIDSFPAEHAIEIARVRAVTGPRVPAACVLWTAQQHGASLASFDLDLGRAATQSGVAVISNSG